MNRLQIKFQLNSEARSWDVASNDLLLEMLREYEGLTGSKYGCGIGECGACTVHIDGQPILSCLTLAASVDGREVVTIEGLVQDGELDPVQEAFLDHAALQCGFCTPGMIMMSRALLDEIPDPSEDDVRDYLRGTLCRCTGYASIVRAVLDVPSKTSSAKRVNADPGDQDG